MLLYATSWSCDDDKQMILLRPVWASRWLELENTAALRFEKLQSPSPLYTHLPLLWPGKKSNRNSCLELCSMWNHYAFHPRCIDRCAMMSWQQHAWCCSWREIWRTVPLVIIRQPIFYLPGYQRSTGGQQGRTNCAGWSFFVWSSWDLIACSWAKSFR